MSLFTPPVEEMKKREAEQEARGMLIDILGEAMLESDMPEEKKISVRIILEIKRNSMLTTEKFDEILKTHVYTEELYAKRKEVLELLQRINAEIENFDTTITPVNKDTNEFKE